MKIGKYVTNYMLDKYRQSIRQDHKHKIVWYYFLTYSFLWFNLEALWIRNPYDRRPLTFIFRDEIHEHPLRSSIITLLVTIGLLYLSFKVPALVILCVLYGFLWGHLIWGSKYIPHQNEWPPYLGE